MRLLFLLLISITLLGSVLAIGSVVGCSSGSTTSKDMSGGGGSICPDHPGNCQGTCCGDKCLNTSVDRNNCGACNAACTGGTVCMGGHCGCLPQGAPCAMGQTCCPMGGCADLMNDLRNCGMCGNVCQNGTTCSGGKCVCGTAACTGGDVCCNGTCMATCNISMPDMATSMGGDGGALKNCDCTGLNPMPIPGVHDQCPLTGQCVKNNCCLEDTFVNPPPAGTCTDPTPCTTSSTPQ
jgi:hypothetical protein